MNVLFLLYDGFVDFEIAILTELLAMTGRTVVTTAPGTTGRARSVGNLNVVVDKALGDINPVDYDALVIPGGMPKPYCDDPAVQTLIKSFKQAGKRLAAICAAPTFLGAAGALDGKMFTTTIPVTDHDFAPYFKGANYVDKSVVADGDLVTAKGSAYVEFAVAVGHELGIFKDREDELETLLFYKNELN
jgi:putative intracellular protease/amidase